MTLHSVRHYSLHKLAKHNLLMAQRIAGHSDPKTTLIYTMDDPEFVREMHRQVALVNGIVENKRTVRRKRLV
jgi:integrase